MSRTFAIGSSESGRVEVSVDGYERQRSNEYFDDNWISVQVSLAVDGFKGRFRASFQAADLVSFRDQLASLYDSLDGEATFATMEMQLALTLTGNGRGGIVVKGEAANQSGVNRLGFGFQIDQTYLANTLSELNEVIEAFPIRAG